MVVWPNECLDVSDLLLTFAADKETNEGNGKRSLLFYND